MRESLITPKPRPAQAHWAFTPPAAIVVDTPRQKVMVRKTVKRVRFEAPSEGRVYAFPLPVREAVRTPSLPTEKRGLTRRRPATITTVLTEQSDNAALAYLAMQEAW